MAPLVSIGGIHLINSTGAPISGGVATAAATTPFALGTQVQLDAAPAQTAWSGGAPFTLGARPIYRGYDNVTVTWPVNIQGTTHENAVAALQGLKLALDTTLYSTAPLLAIQPTGSSTIMYAEILDVAIQEKPNPGLSPIEGGVDIDFDLTFTRSPFFSPAGLTALISNGTMTNTGTGVFPNIQGPFAIAGDLLYEGGPLNLKIIPAAGNLPLTFLLATVYQRTYTGGTTVVTTSSTTGVPAFRDTTAGVTNPARTRNGLRGRVLFRYTALSAKAQLQAYLLSRYSDYIIWRGPWIQPGSVISGNQTDMSPQGIPLDAIRRALLDNGDVDVAIAIRSSDGTSVSITPHSMETLLYYTYCQINCIHTVVGTAQYLMIEQAQNLNGTAYVPAPGAAYLVDLNAGTEYLALPVDVRGTLPLAISGASLYLSTQYLAGGPHNTAHTAVVTVEHLPLFRTLRGA